MIILVKGANGSGKSAYAEKRAVAFGGKLFYIATMLPCGDEGAARVAKHRNQRAGMGFVTLERPFLITDENLPADCTVLVEDVSNLLANNIFGKNSANMLEKSGVDADVFEKSAFEMLEKVGVDIFEKAAVEVYNDIVSLCRFVKNAVLVTISVFEKSGCDEKTLAYITAMHRLNAKLEIFAGETAAL